MSKQRYVQDSFWTDPYIEKLDPSEKLLFLYFLTNPLCNVAGIYEIRLNRVAYETGFEKDTVDRIKQRFIKDGKMLAVDDWIIMANFAKNQSFNPNVLAGMQRIIDDLPDKVKALKGFERLSYFTLLNLTLPNLTKRTEEVKKQPPTNEVSELIKEFENINPACKRMYGIPVQRNACQDLIDTYGFERVKKVISDTLPKTNGMDYFPTINTPQLLWKKWSDLEVAIKRAYSKHKSEKDKVGQVYW